MKVRLGYPPPLGGGGVPEKSGKLEKTREKSGKFEKVRYSFLKPGFLLTRLRAISLLFSNLLYPLSHFSRLRRAISLLFSNLLCSLSQKKSRLRRAYFFFFSITRDNTLPRCRSRQKYPIRNWVNSFLSNHHVDLIFLTDTIMPGIVDLIRNRVNSFLTDTVVEKSD